MKILKLTEPAQDFISITYCDCDATNAKTLSSAQNLTRDETEDSNRNNDNKIEIIAKIADFCVKLYDAIMDVIFIACLDAKI